jgi:opacity protein-like surface antigen
MRKSAIFLFILALSSTTLLAQENSITISGGYAFSNLEDTDASADGYRINASYEFLPIGHKVSHGLAMGYVSTSAEGGEGPSHSTYDISTVPFYYSPKLYFGKSNLKGYAKALIGIHYTWFTRTALLTEVTENDMGLYAGAGLGANYNVNEKVFLSIEYELAYMSNALFRNGLLNTASAGIGFRF